MKTLRSFKMAAILASTTALSSVMAAPSVVHSRPVPEKTYSVQAGPGTKKFYSDDEIHALAQQATLPTVILSSDDQDLLSQAHNEDTAKTNLSRWMPKWVPRLSDQVLMRIVYTINKGDDPCAIPIYNDGTHIPNDAPPVAGIIVVPSHKNFSETYYRGRLGINFPDNTFPPNLLKEGALYIGGHEATHLQMFRLQQLNGMKYQNSEFGADVGANYFIKHHPEFFPNFSKPGFAQQILAGSRAIRFLADGVDDDGEHHLAAFVATDDTDFSAIDRMSLVKAASDVELKIANYLFEQGILYPEDQDVWKAMINRVRLPWAYTLSDNPSNKLKFDLAADKTGFLTRYLHSLNINPNDTEHAETAIDTLSSILEPLFSKDKTQDKSQAASDFMKAHSIKTEDLKLFMNQARSLAAYDMLKTIRYDIGLGESLKEFRHTFSAPYVDRGLTKTCIDGTTSCSAPKVLYNLDHPLLRDLTDAVVALNRDGAFQYSRAQQMFADNLIKGVEFFKIKYAAEAPNLSTKPPHFTP